jgi:hypothetical protein
MQDCVDDLRSTIAAESVRLLSISDSDASIKPAPGKWSPKEIIGHLIDSAANNHGRFVRAQLTDDMVFEGYEQDEWVRLQRYNERRWSDLIALWQHYNAHIASVIESIAPDRLSLQRSSHNLDVVGWKTIPRDQPATLDYFIRDYVAHLKHHLSQIR